MPWDQGRETRARGRGSYEVVEAKARGGRGLRAAITQVVRSGLAETDPWGFPRGEEHVAVIVCLGEVEMGWHGVDWHSPAGSEEGGACTLKEIGPLVDIKN
jgi:hypothetical protein